jgi:hypothetical protein
VAAVHLVRLDPEPLTGVAARPVRREHAVVAAEEVPRRHIGPQLEGPGIVERLLRLFALPRPRLGRELRRDIVVEDVVRAAVLVAAVRPPVGEGLTRGRDHSCDEDEEVDRASCADDRGREAAERVADDDHVRAVSDRLDNRVRVVPPAGGVVFGRQIDGDRFVAELAQLGRHEVPIPSTTAPAVDERERSHSGDSYKPLSSSRRTGSCGLEARTMISAYLMLRRLVTALRVALREEDFLRVVSAGVARSSSSGRSPTR